jgi:hypothetical protein
MSEAAEFGHCSNFELEWNFRSKWRTGRGKGVPSPPIFWHLSVTESVVLPPKSGEQSMSGSPQARPYSVIA